MNRFEHRCAPGWARSCGRARTLLTLGILAGACLCWPAHAEPAGDPARANQIYKDAKDRFEAGETQKSLDLATEAEKIFAHPSITFLKGRILRRLGRLREAAEALQQADSAQLPKALHRPLDEEIKAVTDEMQGKGELRVLPSPATALVRVDGEARAGPFIAWVEVGHRRVEISAPGHQAVVRSVEVQAGEVSELTIALAAAASSIVVVVPGGLRGVEVLVDGVALALADGVDLGDRSPPQGVPAGNHTVVCSRGDKRTVQSVEVGIGAQVDVDCAKVAVSRPVDLPLHAIGWGGVGVGALVFGYGAWGLGSYYLSEKDDPRGVKSSNKAWLGTVYALTGAATGALSYLFLVRHPDAPAPAEAAPAAPDAQGGQ